jgi:manganese/iron transport system permease protein
MGLVAVSVVASFEAVGSLLVFAFLVAPPATAVLLVRRIPLVMAVAVALGAVAVVVGALVSYHHDTAASATMALVAVVECFAVMAVRGIRTASPEAQSAR